MMLEAVVNGEREPMPALYEPSAGPGAQIDKADELRQKWQTELGQVWVIPNRMNKNHDSEVNNG
jgi:hypothetical protein